MEQIRIQDGGAHGFALDATSLVFPGLYRDLEIGEINQDLDISSGKKCIKTMWELILTAQQFLHKEGHEVKSTQY